MTCASYELIPHQPLNADCQKFSQSDGLALSTCFYNVWLSVRKDK